MKQKTIICICKKAVILKLIGGQYQYTWKGECSCGREWLLEDLSEGGKDG